MILGVRWVAGTTDVTQGLWLKKGLAVPVWDQRVLQPT